jgi:hypothetical protein
MTVIPYLNGNLEIELQKTYNLFYSSILVALLNGCGLGTLIENSSDIPTETSEFNKNPNNSLPETQTSIFDFFDREGESENVLRVNRYIWKASLEVLNFLPLEAVDPFSGIIKTGWGSAPGTDIQYQATIYIQDPSLDARSLKVTLMKKNGVASSKTVEIIENAILSRAIQLRLNDEKL